MGKSTSNATLQVDQRSGPGPAGALGHADSAVDQQERKLLNQPLFSGKTWSLLEDR